MSQEPILITADAIVPVDTPPIIESAGVVISGDRITAVGPLADLRRTWGALPTTRHHHPGVMLPGLVNAHTHLELGYQRGRIAPAPFPQWIASLMQNYPPPEELERVVTEAVQQGIDESLRYGVTTVGDISRHCALTRRVLAGGPLRAVSFGEVVGLGKMRGRLKDHLAAATAPPPATAATGHLSIGIAPHAPYTVETPSLEAAVRRALRTRLPLTMHLAELAEEADFLRDLSGPLGLDWDVMNKMDVLDFRIPSFEGGPIRWAQYCGLLVVDRREPPVILAHVNYCDHNEMALLAASRASVAYCPRTHEFFFHRPHRYRDMLAHGINVCLATDSLASNPDLSVLREAQLLMRRDQLDPAIAVDMITRRPAAALGLGAQIGTLTPGKFADLMVLPVAVPAERTPALLLRAVLDAAPQPTAVYLGGTLQFGGPTG